MKIFFQRTGGFTGIPVAFGIDVDALPEPDAAHLRQMIAEADFFKLTEVHRKEQMPDGFQYEITVEEETYRRTIQVTDMSMPDKLRPLIDDLSFRARQRRI